MLELTDLYISTANIENTTVTVDRMPKGHPADDAKGKGKGKKKGTEAGGELAAPVERIYAPAPYVFGPALHSFAKVTTRHLILSRVQISDNLMRIYFVVINQLGDMDGMMQMLTNTIPSKGNRHNHLNQLQTSFIEFYY